MQISATAGRSRWCCLSMEALTWKAQGTCLTPAFWPPTGMWLWWQWTTGSECWVSEPDAFFPGVKSLYVPGQSEDNDVWKSSSANRTLKKTFPLLAWLTSTGFINHHAVFMKLIQKKQSYSSLLFQYMTTRWHCGPRTRNRRPELRWQLAPVENNKCSVYARQTMIKLSFSLD